MSKKVGDKNILLRSSCRQCKAALASDSHYCPLCGLARPVKENLTNLEKEYLENNPLVPLKHSGMCETVSAHMSFYRNILREAHNYLTDPAHSYLLYLAVFASVFGGFMLLYQLVFPLSFILFWLGLVYMGYDSVTFIRSITLTFLIKRLQTHKSVSPYTLQFKIEKQLEKMLDSLRVVVTSFFERKWSKADPDAITSSESFLKAVRILTGRIKKYAEISLHNSALIWRNNVYAIVAMNSPLQEKARALGNKIREAEALLLRFRWLSTLEELNATMLEHMDKEPSDEGLRSSSALQSLLERYHLTFSGPVAEEFTAGFENLPFEIPFKARFYWLRELPPFHLEPKEFLKKYPQSRELFESIDQVRKLKVKLEDQMVLNCASQAVSDISLLEDGLPAAIDARDTLKNQLFTNFLDIPDFKTDSQEITDEVERLTAEARVVLDIEKDSE